MEIVLKRIAKKNSYTIGRLYILKDEEVESVVHSSWMNPQLKRWFEHKIDAGKLTQDRYFCDTLEPTWRNLKGVELQPGEGERAPGQGFGQEGAEDEGHYGDSRRHLSVVSHQVAPLQGVAAVSARCS